MKIVTKCDLDYEGDLPEFIGFYWSHKNEYEDRIITLIREYEKLTYAV